VSSNSDFLQRVILESLENDDSTPDQIRENVETAIERFEQHQADSEI
jgi:uncharacterized protein (UPF0147 family)